MNKTEMVAAINKECAIPKSTIDEVIVAMADVIKTAIIAGEDVTIHKVGTLKKSLRAAHVGRNPITGERIDIPAKMAVKLKVSKSFTDSIQ